MAYNLFSGVCLVASVLSFPVGESVPSPSGGQRYVYVVCLGFQLNGHTLVKANDVIILHIDMDISRISQGAHHRQTRMTGRGESVDYWACDSVTTVPHHIRVDFPLHQFYQKYTHAYGIPIVSSNVSQDAALTRACYTVRFLLADREDVRDAMYDGYARVGVIALTERTTEIPEHSYLNSEFWDARARGLGGTRSVPISTDGEENILCITSQDRWYEEDVLAHEFSHAIHLIALTTIDPSFQTELDAVYEQAKTENLWQHTYAIVNHREYFAEGVQGFFNVQTCRSFRDNVHNHICTRDALESYDPRLFNLITQVFPCMNTIVDRCESNQSMASNQVLRMNCNITTYTTTETITDKLTTVTTLTEAPVTTTVMTEAVADTVTPYTSVTDTEPGSTSRRPPITRLATVTTTRESATVSGAAVSTVKDTLTEPETAPTGPPAEIEATKIEQRALTFSWSKPASGIRGGTIVGYNYKLVPISPTSPLQVVKESTTTQTSIRIADLIPYTEYRFEISAYTSVGPGPVGQANITRTAEAEPTVPLNIQVQNFDDESVTLVWTEPNPPQGIILHYNIRYDLMPPTNGSTVVQDVTGLTYRVGNLQTRMTYFIQVQAETVVGSGPWSDPIQVFTQVGVSDSIGLVVGIVVALMVMVVLVVAIGCVLWRKRNAWSWKLTTRNLESTVEGMGMSAKHVEKIQEIESSHGDVNQDDCVYEDVGLPAWAMKLEIKWDDVRIEDKVLGKGNFGKVRAGKVKIKGRFIKAAIKTLKAGAKTSTKDDFMAEFQTMTKIKKHPNIVCLLGACHYEDILYVALEFLPNGNLRDYLRKIRPSQDTDQTSGQDAGTSSLTSSNLLTFGIDVARGMQHLSNTGIIHRDLAARNILLAEDLTAKVSDFGLSRSEDIYLQKSSTRIPVRWLAIESLVNREYESKSDVWSFGILLWEIATFGSTPYPGIESRSLAQKLLDGYRMPKPENCADEMYGLMMRCWQEQRNDRPSFKELTAALKKMNDPDDKSICVAPVVCMNCIIKPEFDDN